MKVFISWSGLNSISHKIATELNDWLPTLIQGVEPWISNDIQSGELWNEQINNKLSTSMMGIICVTRANKDSPWLNFEAGAIAKGLSTNKVVPLLIDIKPSDISGSPLTQFQAKTLEKKDMHRLLYDINNLCEKPIDTAKLDKLFAGMWYEFDQLINNVKQETTTPNAKIEKRQLEDILEEVLSMTRDVKNLLTSNNTSLIMANDMQTTLNRSFVLPECDRENNLSDLITSLVNSGTTKHAMNEAIRKCLKMQELESLFALCENKINSTMKRFSHSIANN